MSEIPIKVETKMMAFDESTAIAPDRITDKKNIVAFRACSLKKNTGYDYSHKQGTPGISNSKLKIFSYSEKLWC